MGHGSVDLKKKPGVCHGLSTQSPGQKKARQSLTGNNRRDNMDLKAIMLP